MTFERTCNLAAVLSAGNAAASATHDTNNCVDCQLGGSGPAPRGLALCQLGTGAGIPGPGSVQGGGEWHRRSAVPPCSTKAAGYSDGLFGGGFRQSSYEFASRRL